MLSDLKSSVHLWRIGLGSDGQAAEDDNALSRAWSVLSGDERERAARFKFARDRNLYVTGRAILRMLLGRYLELSPESVTFEYNPQGKPTVTSAGIKFNLSHSGAMGGLAISAPEVGFDIEEDKPGPADESVARHFFASSEVDRLMSIADDRRHHSFLQCWTRKEAYLKAKGGGLSVELDKFEVSFGPGEDCTLLSSELDPVDPSIWELVDTSRHFPGYISALAIEAKGLPIIFQGEFSKQDLAC